MYLRARVLLGTLSDAAAGTLATAQNSWVIPPGGDAEQGPSAATADVLKQGEMLLAEHRARCHGGAGLGDGPHRDPQMPPADPTDPYRAPINQDGTLLLHDSERQGQGHAGVQDRAGDRRDRGRRRIHQGPAEARVAATA